jgi:hypothetical protein
MMDLAENDSFRFTKTVKESYPHLPNIPDWK